MTDKELPSRLTGWDFPDTEHVFNGYDREAIPKLSQNNFIFLVERYNDLIDYLEAQHDR